MTSFLVESILLVALIGTIAGLLVFRRELRELKSNQANYATSLDETGVALMTVGNAIEVEESVEVLAGGGPSDVIELTLLLAREMLDLAGIERMHAQDRTMTGELAALTAHYYDRSYHRHERYTL